MLDTSEFASYIMYTYGFTADVNTTFSCSSLYLGQSESGPDYQLFFGNNGIINFFFCAFYLRIWVWNYQDIYNLIVASDDSEFYNAAFENITILSYRSILILRTGGSCQVAHYLFYISKYTAVDNSSVAFLYLYQCNQQPIAYKKRKNLIFMKKYWLRRNLWNSKDRHYINWVFSWFSASGRGKQRKRC